MVVGVGGFEKVVVVVSNGTRVRVFEVVLVAGSDGMELRFWKRRWWSVVSAGDEDKMGGGGDE